VNLVLAGRPVLVVGGGPVALRKVDGLLAGGATDVTVVAPWLVPELADRPVRLEARPYRAGEAREYRLVVVAVDDASVAQDVYDDADGEGVWVNSADDPARCTFTLPAVVRRGDVQLTASTGGASPGLSAWLRERIEALAGPELGELAVVLAERRAAMHAAGESTEGIDWRPIIEAELARLRAVAV